MKHLSDEHPGQGWDHYKMKVTKIHGSAMEHQIAEGQKISKYDGHKILNQKGEWGHNLPPRLVVEDGRSRTHKFTEPEAIIQKQNSEGQNKGKKRGNKGKEELEGQGQPEEGAQTAPPHPGAVNDRVNQHGEIGLSANDKAKSKLPLPLRKKLKLCDKYATSSRMNGMTGINMLDTGLISTR